MAIAKKCDICGKLYELYNIKNDGNKTNGLMFLNLDANRKYYGHESIDCCPECMNSIRNHVDALRNGNLEGKKNDI